MKKQEKTFFVQNLIEELKAAKSVVLVDYSGLNVSSQQELKRRLKEVNAKMIVVKNTLFKLAGKDAKLPKNVLTNTILSGQNALILAAEDPIAPLGVIAKFAEESEVPQLKVGIIEGSFQDKESLNKLSKLPGRDALLIQTVGVISAPTHGIVGTLQANLQELIYILETKSKRGD